MGFMKKTAKEEEVVLPLSFSGAGNKRILIIAGERDPEYLLGRSKEERFIRKTLLQMDLDMGEDAWYTCLYDLKESKGKVNATKKKASLDALINKLNPSILILLGEIPYDMIIYPKMRGRLNGTSWTAFVGEKIPDQEMGRFLSVVYAPEYLLETVKWSDGNNSPPMYERDPSVYEDWKKHLRNAFTEEEFPITKSNIRTTTSKEKAIAYIERMTESPTVSFDYETTGIKPQRKGHKLLSISMSNADVCYAFPYFDDEDFKESFRKFLLSNVNKISHNLQFEAIWSKHIFGVWPENWYWDTMIAHHCLNNRQPTNLKYLTYSRLGVIGYDDSVDEYIRSSDKDKEEHGANAFNRLEEVPIDDLLTYNALDSWYTYYIYLKQKQMIDASDFDYMEGICFTMDTHITFAKMTYRGVCVDEKYLNELSIKLQQSMKDALDRVMASPEVAKWDGEEPFNVDSSKQLSRLLFTILGIKPIALTEKNAPSVDKINLPKYDLPFVKDLLEYRKYVKIYNTYVKQIKREVVDGKVHGSFSMTTVATHRSSSSDPNLQNNPKRDPEAKEYIRRAIRPSPGHKLVEYDHAQLEVRIAACHNKDPNLIKYILDPTTDMHRDSAMDCYILTKEEVTKQIRQSIKSDFVFAEFYGSYYEQISKDMWDRAEELGLREHLASKGIKNFLQFKNHIKKMEERFWDKRFPVYKQYRKDVYEQYKKTGYVDQLTGYRCIGPMKRNNTYNTPGQGDATHVLFWGMNQVNNILESRGMHSRVVIEIHDSLLIDLDPDEEKVVDYLVWNYCTQKVRKWYDWIIVPLMMEKESTEVDGNWAETKGCGYIGENECPKSKTDLFC